MPIRTLSAAQVRQRIIDEAAELAGKDPNYFEALLGPVEPTEIPTGQLQSAWRLAFYHGSPRDTAVIERAVTKVFRVNPMIKSG